MHLSAVLRCQALEESFAKEYLGLGKDAQLLSLPSIMVELHGGFDARRVTPTETMSMNSFEMFWVVHVVPVLRDTEIQQRLHFLGTTALKEEVSPISRWLRSNRFFGSMRTSRLMNSVV